MANRKRATSDALTLLKRWYFTGNTDAESAQLQGLIDDARADLDVGRQIHALRTEAGLTQRQLAKLVGTSASVICDLEDADYRGHSLSMLRRIAAALNRRVQISFPPIEPKKQAKRPSRQRKRATATETRRRKSPT